MSEGTKYDEGKFPLSYISRRANEQESRVLLFGASKYARWNWAKGMAWSRLLDAALRHITAYADGEDVDPETGISHLAHARCDLGFLLDYEVSHPELDDRRGHYTEPDATGNSNQLKLSLGDNFEAHTTATLDSSHSDHVGSDTCWYCFAVDDAQCSSANDRPASPGSPSAYGDDQSEAELYSRLRELLGGRGQVDGSSETIQRCSDPRCQTCGNS